MLILTNILDWNYFWIGLWIFIFVFALVIEFATPQLVSVWFSGGALISFILSLFKVYWWIQLIVFIVSSTVLVACSRKFVTKILQKDIPTNSDAEGEKEHEETDFPDPGSCDAAVPHRLRTG